ncbi:MAG: hypothetical protein ACYTXY_00410 [Nostoc sp.]
MSLNYLDPNDWGRSPLTDRALMLEQIKAESAEESPPVIELEFDEPIGVWRNGEYIPLQDLVVNLPEEE